MGADDITAAAPSVAKAADAYVLLVPHVQIVVALCLTLILLVLAVGWTWPRLRTAGGPASTVQPPPACDDGNEAAVELARAIAGMADELARHVSHLAQAVETMQTTVERMEASILGCKTCPHLPMKERT